MRTYSRFQHVLVTILCFLVSTIFGKAQQLTFFEPADTFHQQRFYTALGISSATYTAFSIGLYHAWYKDFTGGGFHQFNDHGEWRHMDKIGHVYTAYFQSALCYNGARWTGLDKKKSMLTGIICGGLFQTTIEVMDGFSKKWGFSVPDFSANLAGLGVFAAQQYWWDEQRIYLKVSSVPVNYSKDILMARDGKETSSLHERALDLYGHSFAERYLKDYNAQTYWMSVNLHSFLPVGNRWPKWLNIALGYGAENMFGGFENTWFENVSYFILDDAAYPRYSQFYLGLDLDFQKIRTRNKAVNTLLTMFNVFKVPSPALEINTQGQVTFHLFR